MSSVIGNQRSVSGGIKAEAGKTKKPTLEEKLFTVCRKEYRGSHIKVDKRLCGECLSRICTHICPAGVYEWDERAEEVKIQYENCLECGTCRVACEMHNIDWTLPPGGAGIAYRNS